MAGLVLPTFQVIVDLAEGLAIHCGGKWYPRHFSC